MNLYLVSQSINNNYDTFDAIVVAAESQLEARNTHPRMEWPKDDYFSSWISKDRIAELDVKYLGEAVPGTLHGIILASFNAG